MTAEVLKPTLPTRADAIKFFSGALWEAMDAIPQEILIMSLDDLEEKRIPTEVDYLLRKSLWKQVEYAQKAGISHIPTSAIYGQICSQQGFDRVIASPMRLAWILVHPEHELERMRGMLNMTLGRLGRKLATIDINEKTFGNYLRAVELLMNRVLGPLVQKVEAKHAHLNLNKPIETHTLQPADIKDRIESLKDKISQAKDVTGTINDEEPS